MHHLIAQVWLRVQVGHKSFGNVQAQATSRIALARNLA
jgi:hypothetical protein